MDEVTLDARQPAGPAAVPTAQLSVARAAGYAWLAFLAICVLISGIGVVVNAPSGTAQKGLHWGNGTTFYIVAIGLFVGGSILCLLVAVIGTVLQRLLSR